MSPLFYAILLLGYMLINDLNNARFLWKRMSKEYRKLNELKAIWTIIHHMWKRDTSGVYAALAAHDWDPTIRPIVTAFSDLYRQRIFLLISRGYEVISLTDLAQMLGVQEAAAKTAADNVGWTFDEPTKSVRPRPLVRPQNVQTDANQAVTSLMRLDKLAENTVFLELSSV